MAFAVFSAFAQDTESTVSAGIYALVDGEMTHLVCTNGTTINTSSNLLGIEMGKQKFKYKGETAGVQVKDKLVMVINPNKKGITKTPKKYDPFIKSMTPANILIVPLEIIKGNRVYDEGLNIEEINTTRKNRVEFEWEMIDENTFEISAKFEAGWSIMFAITRQLVQSSTNLRRFVTMILRVYPYDQIQSNIF